MGEASELLHSRLGIEDPELVILNVNLKSREGCTESVRFDKCTHGPSPPALRQAQCLKNTMPYFVYILPCNRKFPQVGPVATIKTHPYIWGSRIFIKLYII